jgi:predicted glycogen debranching enzyme
MKSIKFGREIFGSLVSAEEREWLVTNGTGGYAAGTVAGSLTRRYHGLLVAALQPPLGRTLLVSKLDETAVYDGQAYPLFTNRWAGGEVDPHGYRHIESFRLKGSVPVWRFVIADALLEKRIWMEQGANTTYVTYHLLRAAGPMTLTIKALVNYRDYHSLTNGEGWRMEIEAGDRDLRIVATESSVPFYLASDKDRVSADHEWNSGFDLPLETFRGLEDRDDHLAAGTFQAALEPGQSLTIVASAEPRLDVDSLAADGPAAYKRRRRYERQLLDRAELTRAGAPGWIRRLVLAADQFVVDRPLPGGVDGKSIIAGYPWFGDWGRDTMISLPGLTLTTGRPEVARTILRTYAAYADQGMLPNRFPDYGEEPEYNTVDATLWYFQAIRAYHEASGDDQLLRELYPVLAEIITWHQQGTRYNIRVDPVDGLLYAGETGVQLTWMDAKVDDWVVTPRIGKPVEVNALWFNALKTMAHFARLLGERDEEYEAAAERTRQGFARFWNERRGACYDVLDGPAGDDPALRPNQILAVSLPESPLTADQGRAVVDLCGRLLLTSHGLRSLAPAEPDYQGHYGADRQKRDGAYHQGTVWGWLLGPYCLAHLRVYDRPDQALSFLKPLAQQLAAAGLGSLGEVFDGDAPFAPRGCYAQAWSVAQTLQAWQLISPYTR